MPPGCTVLTSVAVTPCSSRYRMVNSAGDQRRDTAFATISRPSLSSTVTVNSGANAY